MWNKKIIYAISLLTLLLSCQACKSSKGNKKTKQQTSFATLDYKTLNVPKMTIAIEGQFNVNGTLRIRKDSAIMISVQPFLGMEVGRVFITQDSLMVIDRMHKRYLKTTFEEVKKKVDATINYNVFQAVFTETLFAYDNPKAKLSDFKEAKVGDLNMLQYNQSGILQEFVVNEEYRVQQATVISEKTSYSLHWNYAKFNALENGFIFPHQIKFQMSSNKQSKNLSIEYKKVELDKKLNFDSSIPSNYEEITPEKLSSMFQ